MAYLCESGAQNDFELNRCYAVAWIYYRAVQLFGIYYFPNTQDTVCSRETEEPDVPARSTCPILEAPFVDADQDLMPDGWELQTMLDPADPGDAWADYDGDGLVNLAEYTHGTNPYTVFSANSKPAD